MFTFLYCPSINASLQQGKFKFNEIKKHSIVTKHNLFNQKFPHIIEQDNKTFPVTSFELSLQYVITTKTGLQTICVSSLDPTEVIKYFEVVSSLED